MDDRARLRKLEYFNNVQRNLLVHEPIGIGVEIKKAISYVKSNTGNKAVKELLAWLIPLVRKRVWVTIEFKGIVITDFDDMFNNIYLDCNTVGIVAIQIYLGSRAKIVKKKHDILLYDFQEYETVINIDTKSIAEFKAGVLVTKFGNTMIIADEVGKWK